MTKKVAIITGAGGGLGSAIAMHLACNGVAIVGTGRTMEPLEKLQKNFESVFNTHDNLAILQQDMTMDHAPTEGVEFALKTFGRLDFLINNAGVGYPKPLDQTSDDLIDLFINSHLRSPARYAREALKTIGPGGAIINITSCLALRGRPGVGIYAAAKAGLIGLTKQIAAEFGPRGIRCNAVAPGVIETDMSAGKMDSIPFRRTMLETIPLPYSTGRPSDIGAAVAFLCSDDARFINAQVLTVDGGWSETHYLNDEALSR